MRMLGPKSLMSTQRYLHLIDKVKKEASGKISLSYKTLSDANIMDLLMKELKEINQKLAAVTSWSALGAPSKYFGDCLVIVEIKQNLKYVEKNVKNGQSIYVYQDLVPSFWFYQDINYSKFENTILYDSYDQDPDDSFKQLTKLKGNCGYWFIIGRNLL